MKKRIILVVFTTILSLGLLACGSERDVSNSNLETQSHENISTDIIDADDKEETVNTEANDENEKDVAESNEQEETSEGNSDIAHIDTIEELEDIVEKDVEETISVLNVEWEELSTEIDTYDKYIANVERIEKYYEQVNTNTEQLCVRLYVYTLNYAELIMESDESIDEKYDMFEDLYDCIYDSAGDELYDEIYDGILDEMYDIFYDGVLDEAYETVPYSDWSDVRSDEYGWWSDARSDVYDKWSDVRSDVYGFWSDIRAELWDDDIEKAAEELDEFRADVEKMTGVKKSESPIESVNIADVDSVTSIDELEAIVTSDVESTINVLELEWTDMAAEINTYDKYLESTELVEEYYSKVETDTKQLCERLNIYALKYAELIMQTDKLSDDKYDEFSDLYDCIYDDAAEAMYEGIYDGILDEMYETFYDGILDDAYDTVPYDEWYDARSDEYDWWYDARSNVYDNWYDTRSDIYDFWSDIRSDLWEDDVEKAQERINSFRDDVEK